MEEREQTKFGVCCAMLTLFVAVTQPFDDIDLCLEFRTHFTGEKLRLYVPCVSLLIYLTEEYAGCDITPTDVCTDICSPVASSSSAPSPPALLRVDHLYHWLLKFLANSSNSNNKSGPTLRQRQLRRQFLLPPDDGSDSSNNQYGQLIHHEKKKALWCILRAFCGKGGFFEAELFTPLECFYIFTALVVLYEFLVGCMECEVERRKGLLACGENDIGGGGSENGGDGHYPSVDGKGNISSKGDNTPRDFDEANINAYLVSWVCQCIGTVWFKADHYCFPQGVPRQSRHGSPDGSTPMEGYKRALTQMENVLMDYGMEKLLERATNVRVHDVVWENKNTAADYKKPVFYLIGVKDKLKKVEESKKERKKEKKGGNELHKMSQGQGCDGE